MNDELPPPPVSPAVTRHGPAPGRVAAVDHGSVRIGVALSDPMREFASPFAVYERKNAAADADYFKRLAADERIAQFVVGLPVHCDGNESQQSFHARNFGKWLSELTGVPVDFFDERFTSSQADEYLAQGEFTKKKRKQRRDMLAAQILLTAYLEAGCIGHDSPGNLSDERTRGGAAHTNASGRASNAANPAVNTAVKTAEPYRGVSR